MSRRLWWWLVLFSALVLMVPQAMAQRPPETHPTDEHRDIVMSWDRSAMPGDLDIYREITGYSQDAALLYGRLHLVCHSALDASTGKCPTSGVDDLGSGASLIGLRLTEQRSGLTTEISVVGGLNRAIGTAACGPQYWLDTERPIWTSRQEACAGEPAVGTRAQLKIPSSELTRLVAGRWKGTLQISLFADPLGVRLAGFRFDLDFEITDYDAVSIYLPEFQEAAPTIGLNLSYDPIARTVGGRAHLDMCLYDGLGSQSEYLGVTVRDSGTRPPGPTGYSVWHIDGAGGDSQRMDYTVTLDHNGARIALRNGVEEQLRNIDTARLRLVMLPGMSQPVFCVPTPLTLDTPRVPIDEKRSGAYQGDLKVELRLPTSRP
ncbi:CfaE/CblD family pilus tip adhesin [Stenotrophomonas sp. SMYL11]|uniref:CfaE/CblD family pilus tip adhesin n=1 Tax=Stenotrophomonas sp. SMYL11 TaxID=3076042 RepID=UPI002E75BFFD|nr:CfaE/CblD family pilus tip adhesin [Stenotrophomonas sp. SMYL11]